MFKTILVDPPYKLCSGGLPSLAIETHYPTQTKDEIIATLEQWFEQYPIAPEAHMYMWGINSYSAGYSRGILDTVEICQHFNFRPITNIIWCKPQNNPTPYGLRCTEVCIFATRWRKGKHREVMYGGSNNPESVAKKGLTSSKDWFIENRGKHSKKPSVFYDFIESRSKGPYLECYARNKREQWTSLGNEV